MWSPKKVEQALFSWRKWRQTIVQQWIDEEGVLIGPISEELREEELREKVLQELTRMDFPKSLWLEVYWICCINSDYSLDNENTYDNIVVPAWLLSNGYPYGELHQIKAEKRFYPPEILNERDLDHFARQYMGGMLPDRSILYPREDEFQMFLPSQHEFYEALNKLKGRPRISRNRGKQPHYSDRLAVRCAVLKDEYEMTYMRIAKRFGLPWTRPYLSRQSDVARWLVNKGRRLIQSFDDSISLH